MWPTFSFVYCCNWKKLLFMVFTIELYVVFLFVSNSQASTLSDAAAVLKPREWIKIQTVNADTVLQTSSGQYDIFDNYSSLMGYDPISDAVYYLGASHHGNFITKFVKYDIATNTWFELTDHGQNAIHGYNHNTVDIKRGVFYFRQGSTRRVYKYTIAARTWTYLPDAPVSYPTIADGFGYFSALDKVVFPNSNNNELAYFDLKSNAWDPTQNVGVTMGEYHALSCDLPKYGLFIFGGGNRTNNLWSINANKTIASIGNPTGSLNINVNSDSDTGCYFLQDPAGGDLLLFHDNGKVYQWNPHDMWSAVSGVSSKMGIGSVAGHAGVSLLKYGVIMAVRRNGSNVEVWLYKHSHDITPPKPPTNLTLQ
jgi:hypothetical protein